MKRIIIFLWGFFLLNSCINRNLLDSDNFSEEAAHENKLEFRVFTGTRNGNNTEIGSLHIYVCKDQNGLELVDSISINDLSNNKDVDYDDANGCYKLRFTLDEGRYVVYTVANYQIPNMQFGANKYEVFKNLKITNSINANSEMLLQSANGKVPMSAVTIVDYKKNKPNIVQIELERLWSKVRVKWDSSIVTSILSVMESATSPGISYEVHNCPKEIPIFRKEMTFENNIVKSIADYYPSHSFEYAKKLNLSSIQNSLAGCMTFDYIPANTVKVNNNSVTKNSVTYIAVKLSIQPCRVFNGTNYETYNKEQHKTIYLAMSGGQIYKESIHIVWFKDVNSAKAKLGNDVKVKAYTDAMYFRVNLADNSINPANPEVPEIYHINGNSSYTVNIQGINLQNAFPAATISELDGKSDNEALFAKYYGLSITWNTVATVRKRVYYTL